MGKIKPISITMNYFDGEKKDATAIRFIQAVLENFLGDNDMAQSRVLQYCEQKIHDRIMEQNSMPTGQLVPAIKPTKE